MAINIVESIQKNLGLPELQKIDPNTQEVKHPEKNMGDAFFYQAAVPAVLIGLYKFSRIKEGNTALLLAHTSGNLLHLIFGNDVFVAVKKVAAYTGATEEFAATQMEIIAKEATEILRHHFSKEINDADVRKFFTEQRNYILKYVPAGLKIGDLFDDDSIDDRTHKMEGPVSNTLHWIEKLFSTPGRKKEENW